MKQATIHLRLSKEASVHKHNVTPIEALLLVAEHHKNAGGNPVEVDKATIKDTPDKRTIDDELRRLRTIYHAAKVKSLLTEIKDLPTEDFEKAVKLGIDLVLPSGKLSETRM